MSLVDPDSSATIARELSFYCLFLAINLRLAQPARQVFQDLMTSLWINTKILSAWITNALESTLFRWTCLTILALTVYGLYNVYWHPLSKFPGPKLWAAFRGPCALKSVQGQLELEMLQLHRKYGPVVRVAPNQLAFSDEAAWSDIYGLLPGRAQNHKVPDHHFPWIPGRDRALPFVIDSNEHARLRRSYASAFTQKAVLEQWPTLLKYCDLLIAQLTRSTKDNEVQDLCKWYNYMTFDVIGDFAFGDSFKCLETSEMHPWIQTLFDGVKVGSICTILSQYGIWALFKAVLPMKILAEKSSFFAFSNNCINQRRKRGMVEDKVDVFNYLVKNGWTNVLTLEELQLNGWVMVIAGSETTATLLTAATWYLCRSPERLKRAQSEVRTAFSEDSDINSDAINHLVFVNAVLKETLRIFPPVPVGLCRKITTPGGQEIAGVMVPENTICAIHQYAASHYERNFTRPDEFLPERWLDEESKEFANDQKGATQPFSFGPRNCIGANLAHVEMRLAMAKMLWNFDMELADKDDPWLTKMKTYGLWEKGPVQIRLKPIRS